MLVHSVRKSLLGVRHTLNGRFLHGGQGPGTSVLRPRLKIQLPVKKWVLWPVDDSDNADQTPRRLQHNNWRTQESLLTATRPLWTLRIQRVSAASPPDPRGV